MHHHSSLARTASTAAAMALLLGLSRCARPAAPASTSPAGPPVELARFYEQDLAFGSCAGYATTGADEQLFASDPRFECARLEVPLDYADPGGTGMNFAAGLATSLAQSPITERFDLIGFDPRGVGATTPAVDCSTDERPALGALCHSVGLAREVRPSSSDVVWRLAASRSAFEVTNASSRGRWRNR